MARNEADAMSSEARKAALCAQAEHLRSEVARQFEPVVRLDALAQALRLRAASLAGQPVVLGAVVVAVAALGPRRILLALRWGLLTLPAHPLGRRALGIAGAALRNALAPARQTATSTTRASRAQDPGS